MKCLLIFVIVVIALVNPSCDKKCKEVTYNGYLPEMNKYFGMYVPDNWWKYKNQDSTKIDSIYISDFVENPLGILITSCTEFPMQNFTLNSNYLFNSLPPITGYYHSSETCCLNFYGLGNNQIGFQAQMNENTDSHPVSIVPPSEELIPEIVLNGNTFYNVLYFEHGEAKVFFAPNVGLVRYITNQDTFSIFNYQVQ